MGGTVFPPFCLTWDHGESNEDNGDLLQKVPCKHCCTQCPWPWGTPIADPCLHQALLETHWQVWVSLLYGHWSFFLGSGRHKVLFVPSKSLFPYSCASSGWLYGRVNGNLLQEGLCHTQVCCTQSPYPSFRPLSMGMMMHTSAGDPQTFKAHLSQSLWGLLVHTRFCLSPLIISGGYRVWFYSRFFPPTILLGFLLCPWTLGIFFWWDPTFSCWWLFSHEL